MRINFLRPNLSYKRVQWCTNVFFRNPLYSLSHVQLCLKEILASIDSILFRIFCMGIINRVRN